MTEKWTFEKKQQLARSEHATFVVTDERRRRICEIFGSDRHLSPQRKEACARLISSAPDLQSALESILKTGMNQVTVEQAVLALRKSKAG